MTEFRREMYTKIDASDPYKSLATAIIVQAADDYRRNMTLLIKHGLSMSDYELRTIKGFISECETFFKSSWFELLAMGLSDVIWTRLQKEFSDEYSLFEVKLHYLNKRRRKTQRKIEAQKNRWQKQKLRRKLKKQKKKMEAKHDRCTDRGL